MSTDESNPLPGVHSNPSDLAAPTVTTPAPNGTVVPEPSKDNDGPPSFTTKPVWDFNKMKFPQQETTICEYLKAMPHADKSGNWNVEEAKTWLDQSMNRMVLKLRGLNMDFSESCSKCIFEIQDFIEKAISEFEETLAARDRLQKEMERHELEKQEKIAEEKWKQEKVEEEAKCAVEEAKHVEEEAKREKLADKQWNKMKADEDAKCVAEEVKQAEEEAHIKEDEEVVARAVELVQENPNRFKLPYPAIPTGQCKTCKKRSLICRGLAGQTCNACAKVHSKCSNNTDKIKARTTGDTPKASRSSSARSSRGKAAPSAEKGLKRKLKEEDNNDDGSVASSSSRKRVKVTSESTLSRTEAVAIVGQMVIEMETINNSMKQMQVLLLDFAGQANGKKMVTIHAPNDDA